jgi:hypothetical protein
LYQKIIVNFINVVKLKKKFENKKKMDLCKGKIESENNRPCQNVVVKDKLCRYHYYIKEKNFINEQKIELEKKLNNCLSKFDAQ